ncbi:DNA-binding response regulator [Gemmobacter aquaticus]|uniref:DNA-binding response regulator n=1 Tax=Gemmobacter aquaticus TaxID=490185 RepID=A0A917YJW3_9RHOB|nr:response regulator [Gemmobacter aquaticus]GGO32881.1 DNA-binding response regulator [Gemmobacter aquaticus]
MNAVVYLVDDDPAVMRALSRLLGAEGFEVACFADATSFLAAHDPGRSGCAVIDLGLPDLDGLELQERLAEADGCRQILFLTGQGTIPASVRAMRAGAVDFLTKPVEPVALIRSIHAAIERDGTLRLRKAAVDADRARLASLTPRETEVMEQVAAGRLNKQIADRLGAAEKTIKVHRGRVMHKLGVRSVADLVRLLARARDGRDGDAG